MKKYIIVLLHSGYWLMFLFSIALFLLIDSHGEKVDLGSPAFIGAVIPGCFGFYMFYSILFDRFLSKKNMIQLFLSGFLVIFIAPVITELSLYLIYYGRIHWDWQMVVFGGLIITLLSLINGVLGLVMKGFISWYEDIKTKVELNKKNYEMELALMKAQINPHFLFNTIHNIDGLIQQNPDKASEYLNKLSDIMRFTLYETKAEKNPLDKELSYIEKYIELQKIRTTNKNFINYEVQGNAANKQVPSMLFIPFIENAFKYTEDKKIERAIKIRFAIEKNKLSFECENAHTNSAQLKPECGGLGNNLIQRRLELLYKDKHSLDIKDENGIYKVNLQLSI